jgi:predicted 3-demethylubiquinone-9 3-methyltransferase (glyoxalase superfamily)
MRACRRSRSSVSPFDSEAIMQKITPFLWFDNQAEDAARFYASIFKNSRVIETTRCGNAGPGPSGSVMSVTFVLDGQNFIALNGGPHFKFNEAISMFVNCEDQREVDDLWERLSEGGEKRQCGWLKDKFGISWQILPASLGPMLHDSDAEKSGRVLQALWQMEKLDIARLRQAYDGSRAYDG